MKTLDLLQKKELCNYLTQFVSDNKKNKIEKNINLRTRHLTVVLEDIFQSQNASAVLRTCDCFGVQDVHIIENRYIYDINPDVELGSAKWLSLNRYNEKLNNTLEAINSLKKQGYKIVATTPHRDDLMIHELEIDNKTALLFGTEKEGLSEIALDNADVFVKIPMYGFTESFNISVSAAMSIFFLTEKIRKSGIQWQLSDAEIFDIKINWYCNVIRMSDQIIDDFILKNNW
jgi:tRNA (guanosine-2'-O-)-methyltransferase